MHGDWSKYIKLASFYWFMWTLSLSCVLGRNMIFLEGSREPFKWWWLATSRGLERKTKQHTKQERKHGKEKKKKRKRKKKRRIICAGKSGFEGFLRFLRLV